MQNIGNAIHRRVARKVREQSVRSARIAINTFVDDKERYEGVCNAQEAFRSWVADKESRENKVYVIEKKTACLNSDRDEPFAEAEKLTGAGEFGGPSVDMCLCAIRETGYLLKGIYWVYTEARFGKIEPSLNINGNMEVNLKEKLEM